MGRVLAVLVIALAAAQAERLVGLIEVSRHGLRTPLMPMKWANEEESGVLTKEGQSQKYEHGLSLRKNYSELFGDVYNQHYIDARATNYSRTIDSLEWQLRGIYPASSSFHIDIYSSDTALLPHTTCPRVREIMTKDQIASTLHQELLEDIKANREEIEQFAGGLTFEEVFNMSDVLVNYRERGLKMPGSQALSDLANRVYEHILIHLWFGQEEQRRLGVTPLLLEVIARFQALNSGDSVPAVSLYCAHDITLVPFLYLFGIKEKPGPGAFIQFELYKEANAAYIRLRYNGNKLPVPRCASPCSLPAFVQSLDSYMLPDLLSWKQQCETGWGSASLLGLGIVSVVLLYQFRYCLFAIR